MMPRRASISRRRLSSGGGVDSPGFHAGEGSGGGGKEEVVHAHLRSRSQERSVSVRGGIAPDQDVLIDHASSTAGSENGDPLGDGLEDPLEGSAKTTSIGGGLVRQKDNQVIITSSGKKAKSATNYHRRSVSDPFDISGLDDYGDNNGEEPVSVGAAPPSKSLPTIPRFPVAETRDLNCWSEPPLDIFKVRGKNYLKDKKKVPSEPFLLRARGCDLLLFPKDSKTEPVDMLERSTSLLNGTLRKTPTLVLNFRFPWGLLLMHFEIPDKLVPFLQNVPPEQHYHGHSPRTGAAIPSLDSLSPGELTLAQWIMGDTHYKNQRLKLIPYVVQGPWVVRNLVTGKPAIIGTKLPVSYKVSADILVAELDIGNSSATAKKIVSLCRRYMNALTCDIGFVIQANTNEELPEQMLGSIRIHGVDPLKAPTFV